MPKRIDFQAVIAKLRSFYAKRRRLPSFSELQELLDYRSKGSVSALVGHLLRRGIVRRDTTTGRLLPTLLLEPHLKVLGTIQAGFPSPAEEELLDTLSLDEFLIRKPEASFLVKVTGDSMIEAGICPGDLVIVERGRDPKPGHIVIAEVDGEWTMKYYEKRKGQIVLRAANKKYPLIFPKQELKIGGIVIANVRKYE
ncbi:MAG: repressor LexA [Candidatus Omnitrophica bacterium]|nr:repressor LexA [Candidatus Omnitrophota bacterium]